MYKFIDLFAGCGGLEDGFLQSGKYTDIAAVEWLKPQVNTLIHRLETKWNIPDAKERVMHFDIQREEELFSGWDDKKFGSSNGLDYFIDKAKGIDVIIGGPPCQAYSIAGRVRDENGMHDDYRNYLFEHYLNVVDRYRPKAFVFENVPGILSAAPGGVPITDLIREGFLNINYDIVEDLKIAKLNASEYGVPQNRERLIYIGNCKDIDNDQIFEEIFKLSKHIPDYNLGDALFGLRTLRASRVRNATETDSIESGSKIEKNTTADTNDYISYINQNRIMKVVLNHKARYNNDRDIEIFGRMEQGDRSDDPKIADIMPYARRNGIFKDKYFKLENAKVCKTITAHMKFDCNMYIHPTQARGLTPREAARVQSYPDDYFFRGAYTKTYMQIGNSVPPLLGRAIAHVIKHYMRR